MSEKRFEFKLKVNFIDEETGEEIYHKTLIDNLNGNEIGFDDMVDLLNEQQATINKLKSDIEETEISIKLFEDDVTRLQAENEQLRKELQDRKIYCKMREMYE